jgi:hypothetical protein
VSRFRTIALLNRYDDSASAGENLPKSLVRLLQQPSSVPVPDVLSACKQSRRWPLEQAHQIGCAQSYMVSDFRILLRLRNIVTTKQIISRRLATIGISSALWLVAAGIGFVVLNQYASTPGPTISSAGQWPSQSQIQRAPEFPTLLMFIHPRCPCTRASVEELDRLMMHARGRIAVRLLYLKPPETESSWVNTSLLATAGAIPGVQVIADDGTEATRFGVSTSGETLLYDVKGQLVFHGGITASRGHAGDNPGLASLEEYVIRGVPGLARTSVFGCPLVGQTGQTQKAECKR